MRTEVIVDLKIYQNQLSENTITDYIFLQKLYNCLHQKLRQQAEMVYNEDNDLKQIIRDIEQIDAVLRDTGVYKSERRDYSSGSSKSMDHYISKWKSTKEYKKQDKDNINS